MKSTQSRIAAAMYMATNKSKTSQIFAEFMQHQPNAADKYCRQLDGNEHLFQAYERTGRYILETISSYIDNLKR